MSRRQLNRRQLLTTLGAGVTVSLTGCIGNAANSGSETKAAQGNTRTTAGTAATPSQTPTTMTDTESENGNSISEELDGQRTIQVRNKTNTQEGDPVSFNIGIERSQITRDKTAQITISVVNESNKIIKVLPFPQALVSSNQGTPGIALRQRDDIPAPDCSNKGRFGVAAIGKKQPRLQSGESITKPYIVVNNPETSGCLEPDDYSFQHSFAGDKETETSPTSLYKLSFSISLKHG
jgi:hypothetical protein